MTTSTAASRLKQALMLMFAAAALAAPAGATAKPLPVHPDQPDGWTYGVTHHKSPAIDTTDRLDGWAYNVTHHKAAAAPVDQLDGWAYGATHRN